MVRAAGERGVQRLAEEMLAITLEERGALVRPIEESERRIAVMRETIAETERSLREIAYLFMAEKHRRSDLFLERREKYLDEIQSAAETEAQREMLKIRRHYGPKFRRDAMHTAQTVAANYVHPWLTKEQVFAEKEYRKVAARLVNIGNEFLHKLSQSTISQLSRIPTALNSEQGFRVRSRFRFEELIQVAPPASPLRYIADIFPGLAGAFPLIQPDALTFFDYLLEINSARVQSDLMARVDESQGQLEAEIRKLLQEVARVASSALEHAREARSHGASAVQTKLERIATAEREIQQLMAD